MARARARKTSRLRTRRWPCVIIRFRLVALLLCQYPCAQCAWYVDRADLRCARWALGQDKNDDEGATEKFKKVNNAYNTLKNGGNGRAVGGDGEYDDESDDEYDDTPYEDFAEFFEEFLGRFFMSRRGVFFPSGRGGQAFFAMGGAGMGARRGAGPHDWAERERQRHEEILAREQQRARVRAREHAEAEERARKARTPEALRMAALRDRLGQMQASMKNMVPTPHILFTKSTKPDNSTCTPALRRLLYRQRLY